LARSSGASHHSFLAVDTSSRAAFARGEEFDRTMSLSVEDLNPFARVLENVEREFHDEFANGYITESKAKLRWLHRYFAAQAGLHDFPPVRCNAPRFSAVIETDGSLKPCFFLPSSGRFDGTSLSRALNTEAGKDLRRQQRLGLRQECSRCVCPAYRGRIALREGM
jgi:MoaA/NifB/PqqE/SkfB family radical SAM enzyme